MWNAGALRINVKGAVPDRVAIQYRAMAPTERRGGAVPYLKAGSKLWTETGLTRIGVALGMS